MLASDSPSRTTLADISIHRIMGCFKSYRRFGPLPSTSQSASTHSTCAIMGKGFAPLLRPSLDAGHCRLPAMRQLREWACDNLAASRASINRSRIVLIAQL